MERGASQGPLKNIESEEQRFNVPGEGGLFGGAIGAPQPPDVGEQSVEDLRAEFGFLESEVAVGAEEQLIELLNEQQALGELPFPENVRALPRRVAIGSRIGSVETDVARNGVIRGRQLEILRELNRRGETLGPLRRPFGPRAPR